MTVRIGFFLLLVANFQGSLSLPEVFYKYFTPRYVKTGDCTSCTYVTDRFGQTSVARAYTGDLGTLPPSVTVCTGSTCGQNAQCTMSGGRPVCSCLRGYTGDPLTYCRRAECLDNSECRGHMTCVNEKCVNPCDGACGVNAICDVRNHVPVCSCPPGYTGTPFTLCRRFTDDELCDSSPCGQNTQCEVINERITCKCLPGYHGSPLSGCRHECETNSECGPSLSCQDFRCQNPCSKCGENAECEGVQNHVAVCKCPRGYFGNPLISCRPECESNFECPSGKPSCFNNQCVNPCDGACGINANCELRNGFTPVCSCPRDMTGNPFISCRPFTDGDLCEPNPCGANSKCIPGHDVTGKKRPVCNCLPGHTGNPLKACIRGECINDSECPNNRACVNLSCINPCINQCGVNAQCDVRGHIAVCTCFPGYNGDALSHCHVVDSQEVVPSARIGNGDCTVCY